MAITKQIYVSPEKIMCTLLPLLILFIQVCQTDAMASVTDLVIGTVVIPSSRYAVSFKTITVVLPLQISEVGESDLPVSHFAHELT